MIRAGSRRRAANAPGAAAFAGLTVADAIKKYLALRGAPASVAEIARALLIGGVAHHSVTFKSTVHGALARSRPKIVSVRSPSGHCVLEGHSTRDDR